MKKKALTPGGYGRRLKSLLTNRNFEVVIIEYIHWSYFLNYLVEDAKLILDAHDIMSNLAGEFKKFNYNHNLHELPRKTEVDIFKIYDHVIVLCKGDYEEVNNMTAPGKALLCPHPVEPSSHETRDTVKNIAYIASAYLPNDDGLNWFVQNCWSQISTRYDVNLYIYGTVGEGRLYDEKSKIFFTGFVPDIEQIYEDSDIIINPVRFGAGVKIKSIEALAHGRPLVTTTHGARGLEEKINKAFLVGNTPEEFVQRVASLIDNSTLRKKLGCNAKKYIKSNFSPKRCFAPLISFINEF